MFLSSGCEEGSGDGKYEWDWCGGGQKAPPCIWGGLLFHKLEDKLEAAELVKRDRRLILKLESVQSKVPFCKDVLKDLDDIYCPVNRIS